MLDFLWALCSTILLPTWLSDASLSFSNSVFSVFTFAALFALLFCAKRLCFSARLKRFAYPLGLLFSVMTAFGCALGADSAVSYSSIPYSSVPFLLSIALFTRVYAQAIGCLWTLLERNEARLLRPACPPDGNGFCARCARLFERLLQRPFLLAVLLLLCWLPCYLSTFPGNFVYDASYEYYQLELGFTRSYPLLHSVIITRLLSASHNLTGSFNPGIALYTIAQMLLASALFAHILHRLHALGLRPALLSVLTAYYALFPVIHLLVTCTTRDVLFSLLLTWLIYLMFLLSRDPDGFSSSLKNMAALAVALVFALLARNNNSGPLIPFLLLIVCLIIGGLLGMARLKRLLLFSAASFGLFFIVSAVLTAMCQPLYDEPPASSMSMLSQPLARAYMMYADTWPQEDKAEFETYFNMETLEYVPQNADPSKGNLTVRYANMKSFLAFFAKIGLRHPACYADAMLSTTRQMWFPDCVVDGYTARGIMPAYDKSYFYFGKYIEEIGSRLNLLPGVFSFYERIGLMISFEKLPVISMLFSIGFQFWILLHCIFYTLYRKCGRLMLPLIVLLAYVLLSSFAPLVLVRYYSALFLAFPMTLVFTLCPSVSTPHHRA